MTNSIPIHLAQPPTSPNLQQGLTLIELLVSIVLMGLVTLGTVTLYSATSQSYKTIDSSQALNDSARFAFEVIGQSLRIAGYQEYMRSDPTTASLAGKLYPVICTDSSDRCPIKGFNNSKIESIATSKDFGTTNNSGINFSDTLGVTFAGSSVQSDPTTPDNAVVDCQGIAQPLPLVDLTDLGVSLFWVTTSKGEPELSCISGGTGAGRTSQPIVRGMETFQVMYGIDSSIPLGSMPNKWVSAQSVGDWMKVRAVRVGFVLRGQPGSSQSAAVSTSDNILYPLGKDFIGTSTEPGLTFTPPNDGRIRRAYTSTFMLRNTP